MSLDKKVNTINAMIQQSASEVYAGNAPDVSSLEHEVVSFIADVKNLSGKDAKQYLDIVSIWSNEIRKISDKLNETKDKLEAEINQTAVQGKAASAYTKTGKQE